MNFDAIVAGAGIWGCTVARRLAELGRKVLVLEKRPVVGGNVRCEIDEETGIEIHKYGSHIFHTHIPEVWEFVNRFVQFNGYQHKVLACTKCTPEVEKRGGGGERMFYLPLGLSLINKFFNVELKPSEVQTFLDDPNPEGIPSTSTSTLNLPPRRAAIFDAFFRGYTSKQWGKPPEEIDPTIIKRVPVRSNYDVNYFNDYWQGIPTEGYNALFERMLDHENITVWCDSELVLSDATSTDSNRAVGCIQPGVGTPNRSKFCVRRKASALQELPEAPIYYSGPIDALFDYKHGALPWRTLRFETERAPVADAQGTSVVNYVDADVPFTRQHEFKHYHPEPIGPLSQAESIKSGKETILMREYSATWKLGDEPYYPVNTPDSAALLKKYQDEAAKISNLVIGGRLGQYKYFDMDKSIQAALELNLEV